ncbi:MAG: glycosyltransferase [Patescibacteria group bacterium]
MKILIASDTYYPNVNGAAYFTYRLANSLAEKGHAVSVICPAQKFANKVSRDKKVTVYGVRSIRIQAYQNFRIAPLAISKKFIFESVQKIAPDVVHVQNHFMIGKGAALAAKKLGIPVIGTNHFMPENLVHYFHLPKSAEERLKKFGWKQCLNIFEQLDFVTTPTQTAANLLLQAGFSGEVLPVSCGIDLARFKPTNPGAYLKKIYGIPKDRPVLLYVGRLDKEKRLETILQALPVILRHKQVHLVLAGIGNEKNKLKNLVRKLGLQKAVTFTGFIPDADLQNIYRVADLFVIAGIAELQSIVTMEAMASGLPVVAVEAMALPELVRHGKNGYLFPDGDSQKFAELVIAILTNPQMRKRMAAESLKIIKNHDIKRVIVKYESLYSKIIRRKTSHAVVR